MTPQRCMADATKDTERITTAMPRVLRFMENEMGDAGPGFQAAREEIEECRKRLDHLEHLLMMAKQIGRG